jgi:hypothetical protein
MAAPCAEPWTVENTRDWMDKALTSTHDLSVWSSSSLGRWHPRSSVLLVLTRHSSPILNEWWTRVINLSMFFLLCYDITTILRSQALHRVLSLAIQYAWCSYMLSRLYRKVKFFRSDLLTFLFFYLRTVISLMLMIEREILWHLAWFVLYLGHSKRYFALQKLGARWCLFAVLEATVTSISCSATTDVAS